MECKVKEGKFRVVTEYKDLIETLWNVKTVEQALFDIHKARFNRNIMECKESKQKAIKEGKTDLIETLWNVKDKYAQERGGWKTDLIETLWNVKDFFCLR